MNRQPATRRSTRFKSGTDKLSGQAADKARGLVGQGLNAAAKRSPTSPSWSATPPPSLDERLGEEYGEYARRAAGALEDAANNISAKNPDELIDDTREFVRKSPGVALAGAAIIGFALVRLVKSGLDRDKNDES